MTQQIFSGKYAKIICSLAKVRKYSKEMKELSKNLQQGAELYLKIVDELNFIERSAADFLHLKIQESE